MEKTNNVTELEKKEKPIIQNKMSQVQRPKPGTSSFKKRRITMNSIHILTQMMEKKLQI